MTKSTRERLEAAIGVMYAEVRTSTELNSVRAAAKAQVEATLAGILEAPAFIAQLADHFDDQSDETDDQRKFREMCRRHDLTYSYSDDGSAYSRGSRQHSEIVAFAKEKLTPLDAQRIWDQVVDTRLVPSAREQFYWRM